MALVGSQPKTKAWPTGTTVRRYSISNLIYVFGRTNFVLIYFGLKGKLERIWQDNEFRWYVGFVTLFTLITFIEFTPTSSLNQQLITHKFLERLKVVSDMPCFKSLRLSLPLDL